MTTWPAFIRAHLALLAGTDFFTAEVLTLRGLVTYYVLFFIHLENRGALVDIISVSLRIPCWKPNSTRTAASTSHDQHHGPCRERRSGPSFPT
jgi:hypothetical protein